MKATERYLSFYEMKIRKSAPTATETHSIDDILDKIGAALGSSCGKKVLKINKTNHEIRLISFNPEYSEGFAVGFVGIYDSTRATPARRDKGSQELYLATKLEGTEDELGCHFFISKKPVRDGVYPFYLEQVEKLGSSNVTALLRNIFATQHLEEKEAGKLGLFSGPHIDGKNKEVGYRPIIDLHGVPVDNFSDIIENGLSVGVSLQNEKTKRPFGGSKILTATRETLNVKFETKEARKTTEIWTKILAAMKLESDRWKFARLSFEQVSGEKVSAKIDTASGRFMEDKFVKKILVDRIDPPLSTSSKVIVEHFANRVLKLSNVK